MVADAPFEYGVAGAWVGSRAVPLAPPAGQDSAAPARVRTATASVWREVPCRPHPGLGRRSRTSSSLNELGLEALIRRRLDDGELDAATLSPDDHFASLDELLDVVATLLLSGLHDDLGEPRSWQGYLVAVAHAMRRVAPGHP